MSLEDDAVEAGRGVNTANTMFAYRFVGDR